MQIRIAIGIREDKDIYIYEELNETVYSNEKRVCSKLSTCAFFNQAAAAAYMSTQLSCLQGPVGTYGQSDADANE